jgi:hypothetical protein
MLPRSAQDDKDLLFGAGATGEPQNDANLSRPATRQMNWK